MLLHVEQRDIPTLWPIVRRWILPGSVIHHDGWAAYGSLNELGYAHDLVNHRYEFINQDGARTNHIESYWSRVKSRMRYLYGSQGELQWSHLDEIQYLMWFHWTNATVFLNFVDYIEHVGRLYRV